MDWRRNLDLDPIVARSAAPLVVATKVGAVESSGSVWPWILGAGAIALGAAFIVGKDKPSTPRELHEATRDKLKERSRIATEKYEAFGPWSPALQRDPTYQKAEADAMKAQKAYARHQGKVYDSEEWERKFDRSHAPKTPSAPREWEKPDPSRRFYYVINYKDGGGVSSRSEFTSASEAAKEAASTPHSSIDVRDENGWVQKTMVFSPKHPVDAEALKKLREA